MITVDKIITISLNTDDERRQQTQQELAKLQLTTEFFLAEKDPSDRVRGCFHSHLQVAKKAFASGCNSVLVFEDDVHILPFTSKQIQAINHFVSHHTHFDVLYLGLIISKMWFCGAYPIVRAKGAGCHAYILSRQGMEKLSQYLFTGIAIDKIIKSDFRCYSIYPIIANQYPKHIAKSQSYSQTLLDEGVEDQRFWNHNLSKQKWILFKNLHKGLRELLLSRVKPANK